MRSVTLALFFCIATSLLPGQVNDSRVDTMGIDRKRLTLVIATESVLYTGIMVGLNELWYNDFERAPFHFFNDNAEWRGIDKVGHSVTGYYVGVLGMDALRWAGVDDRSSRWYGGALGWFFLTSFEVLDGTSAEWGFSPGDMVANTVGAGLAIGQDAAWAEQRIVFKFSTHTTDYASLRPEVLGHVWREQVLKDYNGQTYWLSANLHSFLKDDSKMPKWLNLSVGYSIEGMVDARDEYFFRADGVEVNIPGRSQWYLAPDVDLWRIPMNKKWLKTVMKGLGFIKFPSPALEVDRNGVQWRWFYF